MIGFLRGRLAVKHPPALVVDVGGVGYELEAPMSTFYDLPAVGEEVMLLTHLLVREDAQVLYGFGSEDERRLFRALLPSRYRGLVLGFPMRLPALRSSLASTEAWTPADWVAFVSTVPPSLTRWRD